MVLSSPDLKVVTIELNQSGKKYGIDDESIFQLLSNYGFKPYNYDVKTRKFISLERYNTQKFNTIFIRNNTFVQNRLYQSDKIKIRNKNF